MAQLSDSIEQFIKDLMEEDRQIDLKRNELAQHFGCAPSQINYVLATRFSIDHGYVRIRPMRSFRSCWKARLLRAMRRC